MYTDPRIMNDLGGILLDYTEQEGSIYVETPNPLHQRAMAGEFGPVVTYETPVIPDPTPEELRALMPPLARWRLNTIIDQETGLRDKINSAIAELPEPHRSIAKNKLADVVEFIRVDTLFDMLAAHSSINKSPEDIDVMWAAGLAL